MIDELIDKIYELYDRLVDKAYNVHNANVNKVKKVIADYIENHFLGNYMINMQMYELRHGEEDISHRLGK